jgi:hypothetical protein
MANGDINSIDDLINHPDFAGMPLPDKNKMLMTFPEFSQHSLQDRQKMLDVIHYGAPAKAEEDTSSILGGAKAALEEQRFKPTLGEFVKIGLGYKPIEMGYHMLKAQVPLIRRAARETWEAVKHPHAEWPPLGAAQLGLHQAEALLPVGGSMAAAVEEPAMAGRQREAIGRGLVYGGELAAPALGARGWKASEPMRGAMAERLAQSLLGPEPKGMPPVSSPARALVAEGPLAVSRKGGWLTTGLRGSLGKPLAEYGAAIRRTLAASKEAPPEPLEPIVRKATKPLMDEARDLGHPEIADRIEAWATRYLAAHPAEVPLAELYKLRRRMGSNQPLFKGTSEEFSDLKGAKKEVYRAMNEALDRRMPGFRDVTQRQSGLIQARQMLKEQARREAGGPILPTPRLYGGVSGGGGDFAAARIGMPVPFETLLKTGAIKVLGKRLPLAEPMPAAPAPPRLAAPLGPPEPGAVTPPQTGGMSIERLKALSDRLAAERMAAEGAVSAPVSPLGRGTLAGFPMEYHRAATAEATAPVPLGKTPALHAESAELATVKGIKTLVSTGQANKLTPAHLAWLEQYGVNINEPGAVAAALKAANSRLAELAGTAKGKPAPVARGPAPSPWAAPPQVAPPPGPGATLSRLGGIEAAEQLRPEAARPAIGAPRAIPGAPKPATTPKLTPELSSLADELIAIETERQPATSQVSPQEYENYRSQASMGRVYAVLSPGGQGGTADLQAVRAKLADAGFSGDAPVRQLMDTRRAELSAAPVSPLGRGTLARLPERGMIPRAEVLRGTEAYQGPIGVRETLPEPRGPTAPVVGGAQTTITVPGEARTYQARYEVRELDDVHASHSGVTFQENPNYRLRNERDYLNPVNQGKVLEWSTPDKFESRYHVTDNPDASNGPTIVDQDGNALGGNARAMILERVYRFNPRGAEGYKSALIQNASGFGLDQKAIRGMKRPVLVRVVDDASIEGPAAKRSAIADFNKKPTAELTPSERAFSDSKRVSQETLDDISARLSEQGEGATLAQVLSGESGKQVIVNLVRDGVVSPQEYAGMAGKMGLTDAAKERVGKLLIGRFFEDAAQMDNTPPFVKAKLERISAPAAKASAIPEWSVDADIRQAVDLVGQVQAHGLQNVSDLLRQGGMFGPTGNYSPRAVALAESLQTQGVKALTEAMRRYAQDAVDSQRPMVGMFGQKVSPQQAFQEAFGERK